MTEQYSRYDAYDTFFSLSEAVSELEATILGKDGLLAYVARAESSAGACLTKEVLEFYGEAVSLYGDALSYIDSSAIPPFEYAALETRLSHLLDSLADAYDEYVPHMAYWFTELAKKASIDLSKPTLSVETAAGTLSVFLPSKWPDKLVSPVVMRFTPSEDGASVRYVQCVRSKSITVDKWVRVRTFRRTGRVVITKFVWSVENFDWLNDPWGVASAFTAAGDASLSKRLRPWYPGYFYSYQGPMFDLPGRWYLDTPSAGPSPSSVYVYKILDFRTYVLTAPGVVVGYLEWQVQYSYIEGLEGFVSKSDLEIKLDPTKVKWVPADKIDSACESSATSPASIDKQNYILAVDPRRSGVTTLFDPAIFGLLDKELAVILSGIRAHVRSRRGH